jgi:hypothetical protein
MSSIRCLNLDLLVSCLGQANVGRANVGRANVGRANVGRANVGRASVGRAVFTSPYFLYCVVQYKKEMFLPEIL